MTSAAAGLCSVGTVSGFSGNGPWSWQCSGSNGGTAASCVAYSTIAQQSAVVSGDQSSSSYAGQSVNIPAPSTGGIGVFLSVYSSNTSIVSVPSTVYLSASDTSIPGTCVGHGTATVTIYGSGFPNTTRSVTCQ
jgi:hypothetical protein